MDVLGVRLPEELHTRLCLLAEKTHRSKTYYVKEALERYLEDAEDYMLAVQAYEEHLRDGGKGIPLEEIMKEHRAGRP